MRTIDQMTFPKETQDCIERIGKITLLLMRWLQMVYFPTKQNNKKAELQRQQRKSWVSETPACLFLPALWLPWFRSPWVWSRWWGLLHGDGRTKYPAHCTGLAVEPVNAHHGVAVLQGGLLPPGPPKHESTHPHGHPWSPIFPRPSHSGCDQSF